MTAAAHRTLAWEGCLNVRDLGGHPTSDGGETRFGAFVRADSIRLLSDEGWRALLDYGVRTVIDLRTDAERADDPPADVPVDVLHIDLIEPDEDVSRAADLASRSAPDDATSTRDVYLIFLERYRANFARVAAEAANAPADGAVVLHCVGGKDRTGLVSALLLRLAGVPEEEVAADYALSEERLRPRHERWLASAETEAERERMRRISVTPPAAMAGVLRELDRRYGGVDGYLLAGGASEEDLAAVRRRLRG
jgi:protein-tyrosine phosphatase